MNDIFKRIKANHQAPSEMLQQAQALVRSNLPVTDKREQLEQLAAHAPAHEQEQFGDLFSNLQLHQED